MFTEKGWEKVFRGNGSLSRPEGMTLARKNTCESRARTTCQSPGKGLSPSTCGRMCIDRYLFLTILSTI